MKKTSYVFYANNGTFLKRVDTLKKAEFVYLKTRIKYKIEVEA